MGKVGSRLAGEREADVQEEIASEVGLQTRCPKGKRADWFTALHEKARRSGARRRKSYMSGLAGLTRCELTAQIEVFADQLRGLACKLAASMASGLLGFSVGMPT